MVNALIFLGMIAVLGVIIVLLDWLGQRRERRAKHHPAA